MCKRRNATDPLVRLFLESYGVNLLPLPRRSATPGELYIKTGRKMQATSGPLATVVEPGLELPEPATDPLPDMSGLASDAVEMKLGVQLAGNFLAAVGVPPGVVDDVKAGYEHSATAQVAFRFDDVTREWINPVEIGTALIDHRFRTHPWVRDGNRYYVAAAFVRSPSMSIRAQDSDKRAVDVGAGVVNVLEGTASVSVEHQDEGTLAYRGEDPLAIAVELYELEYEGADGFRMGGVSHAVALQRGRSPDPEPAFPAEDDEALLDVEPLVPESGV